MEVLTDHKTLIEGDAIQLPLNYFFRNMYFYEQIYLYLYKYWSEQIKKNEMGGVCGTYGSQERCIQRFGEKTREKETTWEA
jgi:hypothetical protein